ncbi:MAG: galactokinase [Candidatus Omnitrophica bacterium]|nr:galactokinase [Candidatus Omnitrophota bacterium]
MRSKVFDRPKVLADINGQAFLDILIKFLAQSGFIRFILCLGYRGDMIRHHVSMQPSHLHFEFSQEDSPLGTAGALKHAQPLITSSQFLVLNGDSLCRIDYGKFFKFHYAHAASTSMVVRFSSDATASGLVVLDHASKIIAFKEKLDQRQSGFINAGIYAMDTSVFSLIPDHMQSSLEYDIFPQLALKAMYGFQTEEELIEIGTPEGLSRAISVLPQAQS